MLNKVELIGHYGGDKEHALSAWTSTSRFLDQKKIDRIPSLLNYLAKEGHHTPFEKSTLHFLVTADIATHIHFLKHRIGVNCIAGDTEIYIPKSSMNGANNGVKKKTIKQLYEEYNLGIISKSKNGKEYRRKYGRKTPVRTKEKDTFLVKKSYISNVFYNGKAELFEFTTSSGKKIKTTLNHKFYTPDGFVEIGKYLDIIFEHGIATLGKKGLMVATNGVNLEVEGKPYTFRTWWDQFENKYTRKEVAKITNINYNTIKKWGYIFDITFKKDLNKDFKKGQIPWNKNRYGYKVNRKKRGINPNINKKLPWKIWRTSVGNWTREQLPKLLEKFNYVCQAQLGKECSRDFDNLCLVCKDCHKLIHSNYESEQKFAEQYYTQDLKTTFKKRKKRKGNKLSFGYEEITHVRYVGTEDVYDLEVEDTHCYVANGFLIHNCNTESARYKELTEDKYYLPTDWDIASQNRLEAHILDCYEKYHTELEKITEELIEVYNNFTTLDYENNHIGKLPKELEADFLKKNNVNVEKINKEIRRLCRKRAKESARFYLPYGIQLTFDVSFNFRSFAHFLNLRNKPDAQYEIRMVAKKMLELVKNIEGNPFEHTIKAFKF